MPIARKTVVDVDQVGVYHCISRCVRRAFLCGLDKYLGVDYEHRRTWIADRLKELSYIFGMEVFAYAVMSNHVHLVVRNRPDLAKSWTAEEVAHRWCSLFPKRNAHGVAEAPGDEALKSFIADPARVELCRERLGDISWFMRCLNEPIARRATGESGGQVHRKILGRSLQVSAADGRGRNAGLYGLRGLKSGAGENGRHPGTERVYQCV